VIAHQEPRYTIGDAVVYRNRDLQSFVFHRIIAVQQGRYSLQGDNNSWVDTYQPSEAEIIGKLWYYIPRGGAAIQKLRDPWIMALLAAGLGGVLATSLLGNKTKGNMSMNKRSIREFFDSLRHKTRTWLADINTTESQSNLLFEQRGMLEGSFFTLGLISLLSLFLGIIVFSRPTLRLAQADLPYEHLGVFSYSASAPQGIYDANAIKSGDPIFPLLTCSVDVTFQYTLIAAQAGNISGTYQMTAVVSEPASGWQRRLPLQDESSFNGTVFGTTAKLDACKIEELTESLEKGTNFHPGSYRVLLTPNVKLKGTIGTQPVESSFDSGLAFQYDHSHLYVAKDEEVDNPFSVTKTDMLQEKVYQPNTLILFGNEMSVLTLRWLAAIGLALSLAGFVFLGLKLQSLSVKDQDKFFRVKYDSLIVDIQNSDPLDASNFIEVKSIDALAKLAERFNAMMLHLEDESGPTYYVQGAGTTYRFQTHVKCMESTLPAYEAAEEGDRP
jgi:hypothetical protein